MKRLAFLAVLAIATLGMTSSGIAATKSNWRALNDDLAPVNLKLAEDVALLNLAVANAGQAQQMVFFTSVFNPQEMQEQIDALQDALKQIDKAEDAVQADARKGIAVLDSYAPEKCSAHFVALEYTMFAAWDETIAALKAKQATGATGAAFWLGGFSGVDGTRLPEGGPIDAEWSRTRCQGASPSPGPSTATESPGPS